MFHGGAVMHTAVLPLGGNHLTSDVAAGLRTPLAEAEQLKIAYGVATNLVVRRDEIVQVPGVGGREPQVIARRILAEIIEPRMEEIFAMAQRELMRSGVADSLASGLVLVGGTSLLEGTQELAERIFGASGAPRPADQSEGHARGTDETDVHDRGGPAAVPGRRARG